ncbi:hypothetical protein B0I37DRAFT_25564 [Chaetomium sp. MPI-CAGE-AT-0009]|nr:hypothetical protein B0I37DRAFT_25564 [Chaetomium sp. MPI-CAGE-AT-0009]
MGARQPVTGSHGAGNDAPRIPDAGHKPGTEKLVSSPPRQFQRQKQQRGWYAVRLFSSTHLNRIEDGM